MTIKYSFLISPTLSFKFQFKLQKIQWSLVYKTTFGAGDVSQIRNYKEIYFRDKSTLVCQKISLYKLDDFGSIKLLQSRNVFFIPGVFGAGEYIHIYMYQNFGSLRLPSSSPCRGLGNCSDLAGANKYSCILIHTISYPYIHTYTQRTM